MNLEQTKHFFFKNTIDHFRKYGVVNLEIDAKGFTIIGNGYIIDFIETQEIISNALNLAKRWNDEKPNQSNSTQNFN